MERRLRELDRWDELYGVGATPPLGQQRRRRLRHRRRFPLGWLVVASLIIGALALPGPSMALLTRVGDLVPGAPWSSSSGSAQGGPPTISFGNDVGSRSVESAWQPPTGSRVLPPVPVTTEGAHEFLAVQPGTGEPVGFSPCAVIEVEVNPDGAPEAYAGLVADSLARLSAATGLSLQVTGRSSRQFDEPRSPGDPVLVSWSTGDQMPELAGSVAGYGGPLIVTDSGSGRQWLASGAVVVDRESVTPESIGAVLDHELGHVLGLGHVDAPEELMAPTYIGQSGFGPGDLAGLARLGAIDCP